MSVCSFACPISFPFSYWFGCRHQPPTPFGTLSVLCCQPQDSRGGGTKSLSERSHAARRCPTRQQRRRRCGRKTTGQRHAPSRPRRRRSVACKCFTGTNSYGSHSLTTLRSESGVASISLSVGQTVTLTASCNPWDTVTATLTSGLGLTNGAWSATSGGTGHRRHREDRPGCSLWHLGDNPEHAGRIEERVLRDRTEMCPCS